MVHEMDKPTFSPKNGRLKTLDCVGNTKKAGDLPPPGAILASSADNFQGIQREVLPPGMYYVNPYEKEVKIVNAVVVPDGFVGVQKTSAPKVSY